MGGRCNSEGLTSYGQFFIDAMTSRGMLIHVDPVSYKAREQILTMAKARRHPLVSSHTGFVGISNGEKANESNPTFEQFRRIINGGGVADPILHQGTLNNEMPGAISNQDHKTLRLHQRRELRVHKIYDSRIERHSAPNAGSIV